MMDQEDYWKVVAVESGIVKAGIVKGRLETEDIPVKLRYEAAGKIYGLTLDGLGEVEILVPSNQAQRAIEILSHSYEQEELPWSREKDA